MVMIVRRDNLRWEHFEQFPFWAEYESPDDFNLIREWGEAGDQIIREIVAVGYSDAYCYPFLGKDPFAFGGIMIRAVLQSADGTIWNGYVLIDGGFVSGDGLRCLGGFVGDEHFCFNCLLGDFAERQLERMQSLTGLSLSPFFPLRWTTEFFGEGGKRCEGVFDFVYDWPLGNRTSHP